MITADTPKQIASATTINTPIHQLGQLDGTAGAVGAVVGVGSTRGWVPSEGTDTLHIIVVVVVVIVVSCYHHLPYQRFSGPY